MLKCPRRNGMLEKLLSPKASIHDWRDVVEQGDFTPIMLVNLALHLPHLEALLLLIETFSKSLDSRVLRKIAKQTGYSAKVVRAILKTKALTASESLTVVLNLDPFMDREILENFICETKLTPTQTVKLGKHFEEIDLYGNSPTWNFIILNTPLQGNGLIPLVQAWSKPDVWLEKLQRDQGCANFRLIWRPETLIKVAQYLHNSGDIEFSDYVREFAGLSERQKAKLP